MELQIEVDEQATGNVGDDNEQNPKLDVEETSESAGESDGDRSQASTESLSGSVLDQYEEHGRSYCNVDYYMPNDEAEQTRLSIIHQAFIQILDGQLTMSRIPSDIRCVLDIGTGTGDWATAFGERFPDCEVIATDIATFQPENVPPNVCFEVDDAKEGWTYAKPFDFIHMRGLKGAFPDWVAVYTEARKHLRDGGSLEVADFGTIKNPDASPDSYLSIYNGACQSAAGKAGTPLSLDHMKKQPFEAAGLSIARSRAFDVPLGSWNLDPRKQTVGKMALISALEGLEASSLRLLTRHLGWKEEAVRDLCAKVTEELMRPGVRASISCQFVIARLMPTYS